MFEDQYKNTTLCLHFKCQTRRFLCFSFFLSCHLLKKHFKILFKHINTASHCFKNQILMKWLQMPSHTVRVTKATLRMSFQCLICFLSLFRSSSTMICKALKVYRSYPSYPSSGSAPFLQQILTDSHMHITDPYWSVVVSDCDLLFELISIRMR